ncbi:hypothetical protein ACS0TY_006218 [Phlomoides rotata]
MLSEEHTVRISCDSDLRFTFLKNLHPLSAPVKSILPASVLSNTFGSDEYRKSWGRKLHMASTTEQLLQDAVLNSYPDVTSDHSSCGFTAHGIRCIHILYRPPEKNSSKYNEVGDINKFPSIYSALGRSMDNVSQVGSRQDSSWAVLQNGRDIMKRGRGRPRGPTRTRGGKSQRRATNPQDESCNMAARKDKIAQRPAGWKGRSRARGSSKKATRSIRSRQKPDKRAIMNVFKKRGSKDIFINDATSDPQQEEWNSYYFYINVVKCKFVAVIMC